MEIMKLKIIFYIIAIILILIFGFKFFLDYQEDKDFFQFTQHGKMYQKVGKNIYEMS